MRVSLSRRRPERIVVAARVKLRWRFGRRGLQHARPLLRRQKHKYVGRRRITDGYLAFVDEDLRFFLRHEDIENRSAHGDDSRRRVDPVRIRTPADLLDLNARFAAQHVEERARSLRQVRNLDGGLFADDRLRAVAQSENETPALQGLNDISGEQRIVDSILDFRKGRLRLRATLNLNGPIAAENFRRDQSLRLRRDRAEDDDA